VENNNPINNPLFNPILFKIFLNPYKIPTNNELGKTQQEYEYNAFRKGDE